MTNKSEAPERVWRCTETGTLSYREICVCSEAYTNDTIAAAQREADAESIRQSLDPQIERLEKELKYKDATLGEMHALATERLRKLSEQAAKIAELEKIRDRLVAGTDIESDHLTTADEQNMNLIEERDELRTLAKILRLRCLALGLYSPHDDSIDEETEEACRKLGVIS